MTELTQAFQSTLAVLSKVGPSQLDAPTPCASWDVRALINHFTGTARWWAASVTGEGDAAGPDCASGDFVAAYEESIQLATAVFETGRFLEKTVTLPFGEFPGAVVMAMCTIEQFTHGWDLARAIGHHTDLEPALADALLGQAKAAIGEAHRGPDGQAFFGPIREAPANAAPTDKLAAFLGRPV